MQLRTSNQPSLRKRTHRTLRKGGKEQACSSTSSQSRYPSCCEHRPSVNQEPPDRGTKGQRSTTIPLVLQN